jgi:maltose alpha-D-glucosyltransferase/alpha-amylase
MVTADERDYMYFAYSADPKMRLNLGIRRRLSPLVDHNRHRIELLNSLLLSLPGTPVIYYGDEIGMGDNVYLGDRNGVRTPMQWSADRNAGFSRVTPGQLYSSVIMDPVYGYEAVNVEAQQGDPSSLLHWTRNMIALRKLFGVFGRGSLQFLHPENRKILAYLREYQGETILCVANLSRFAQPVELDLSAYEGMMPVEMIGYVEFPLVGSEPYRLTLGAYGFLWFELHGESMAAAARTSETLETEIPLDGSAGWEGLFTGFQRERLEKRLLPRFLPAQRWFGAKAREITQARIEDWGPLSDSGAVLALLRVGYAEGDSEDYVVPLALGFGQQAEELLAASPVAVVAGVTSGNRAGILYDALWDDSACATLLGSIESAAAFPTQRGQVRGVPGAAMSPAGPAPLSPRRTAGEQSNTSVIYGERLILKLYRRCQPGTNPDAEIDRFLTERAGFAHVPPFAGTLAYERDGTSATLALLQGMVRNEGDGWTGAVEELQRYYEAWGSTPFPAETPDPRMYLGIYLDSAARLGRRTAELHVALAAAGDEPDFAPEPFTSEDVALLAGGFHQRAAEHLEALKNSLSLLPDEAVEEAGMVLRRRRELLAQSRELPSPMGGRRIRIHGDYHLGQVLRARNDFVILDFEGEPARPLAERRAKHSPLKDVAGMLRSFSYAAYSSLVSYTTRRPEATERLESWARLWERSASAAFLAAYRERIAGQGLLPETPAAEEALLRAYLVDKALYEVHYELNNRPGWVRIPLWGLASL